ncbi:MAG: hypothetical protein NXI01_01880 [Gammaproteobacteria bacterium]|nr:hypothetical protein [Gammaproteobacteria bacterium]
MTDGPTEAPQGKWNREEDLKRVEETRTLVSSNMDPNLGSFKDDSLEYLQNIEDHLTALDDPDSLLTEAEKEDRRQVLYDDLDIIRKANRIFDENGINEQAAAAFHEATAEARAKQKYMDSKEAKKPWSAHEKSRFRRRLKFAGKVLLCLLILALFCNPIGAVAAAVGLGATLIAAIVTFVVSPAMFYVVGAVVAGALGYCIGKEAKQTYDEHQGIKAHAESIKDTEQAEARKIFDSEPFKEGVTRPPVVPMGGTPTPAAEHGDGEDLAVEHGHDEDPAAEHDDDEDPAVEHGDGEGRRIGHPGK